MAKKIEALYADLMKYVDRIEQSVDEKVASAIGFTVRQRMLMFISRGISPILGHPRFKEYLAVTRGRGRKAAQKEANRNLRINRNQTRSSQRVGGTRLQQLRQERKELRARKQQADRKGKAGYPYSVQYKYPGKKPRPVNLFLSGDFLSSLTFAVNKAGKRFKVSIGWEDKDQAVKERGHREGAGGQPKRPALPQGKEVFNQTIQLDIMKLLRDALTKATKSARKG